MPTFIRNDGRFRTERPWAALDLLEFEGETTARLHWTDSAYKWHVNDGPEVFVVISGIVDMHHRLRGSEQITRLEPGDICLICEGEEHRAAPLGVARILVIESKGSI